MTRPIATPTAPRPATAALLLFFLVIVAGCAARETAPPPAQAPMQPVTWTLTRDAAAAYYFLLYMDELRQGNPEQAERALYTALEIDPSPSLHAEAADLQWRMGRPAKTREHLQKALKDSPGDRLLVMRLADSYLAERRIDDALTTLELWLKDNPGDPTAILRMADIQIETRRFAQAAQTLQTLPREARGPESRYLEAKAQAGLGNHRRSIEILSALSREYPDNILYLAELAYQYEITKDYPAAERTYIRILEFGEVGDEIWLRLIAINLKLNNVERALDMAREAPQSTEFLMEAARTFIAEGFPDEAEKLLSPLSDAPGSDPRVHFYLALLAFDGRGDAQKALEHLERIPPDGEMASRATSFKAHMLFLLKRFDEARELVATGKRDFPEVRDFWEIESWLHEEAGQYDEARLAIEEALTLWPDDTRLIYRLGVLQHLMGDDDAAIETMEQIIAIEPDNAEALNFVGYLLADMGRDLDRALVLIEEALEQKPDSGHILDSLAWVHYRRGDLAKAWDAILLAVEKTPEDPTIWEHYGDIARAKGRVESARRGYRKALEFGHKKPDEVRAKLDALKKEGR
ncbi:Tetratricopeptide repeat-containing protein [Alkalidesulfovibrio alkalitolerans DSM 16529]|uniref:Tetratricopeptide repeat-containing protein n=1 Tax=Alkalidesulfovibrio alkalitolerans DSM 16529 TaxID=1121439 RepID=S7TDZ0_9BACT|nr:tetratricopeptide repeat protein [Alkalidesulfovibrio alkalitolerans]EPR34911.1 Tetratricopeptide repeat-containing protein [Alkalidesulfovibrio alkalitolerans DSM 16529]